MDVSIIIVNYNTRAMLKNCLVSIFEKTSSLTYEIIVVDNDSSDGSSAMLKSDFPQVLCIDSGMNLGFGRANNLGSKRASGEYLFFLNSDTLLISNAIFELFTFLKNNRSCGIAGGNLTDLDGNPVHSHSMAIPSPFNDLLRLVPLSFRLLHGRNWTYNYSGKPMRVAYVTGADLMISRDLFNGIGGFDPDFFMYYEETEMTHRVRNRKLSVFSVPSAKITHIKGGSLENLDGIKSVVYTSKFLYMKKVFGYPGVIMSHVSFMIFCYARLIPLFILGKRKNVQKYQAILSLEKSVYRGSR